MAPNASQKQTLLAISLTLLIASCASSSNLNSNNSENNDNYWYCAPGDQRTWRCAEDDKAPGLNYYRPQETMLEPEESVPKDFEQTADDPIMVQGVKVSDVEEVSPEVTDETMVDLSNDAEGEGLDDELFEESPQELLSEQRPEQPAAETKPAYAQYGKVLQLAAYHSQSQARSFVDSLDKTLPKKPSLIRTRVNNQIYYTIVFDQLSSQMEAEQLIAELAESFPTIQPWLRSRSGFEALRAD